MRGAPAAAYCLAITLVLGATLPAVAATREPDHTVTHTIRPGDTLWSLGRRFGVSADQLAALNGMSSETILKIGQPLKIPGTTARSARTALPARMPMATYRVQVGETLWRISRRYGTTPERLAALNGISPEATLRIGQRLKVPAPPPAAPVSAGAPASGPQRVHLAMLPSRGAQWMSTIATLSTRYLGARYRWGGESPGGFDCSGFLSYVFKRTGVNLPRTTYEMFRTGTEVSRDQLQTGDIVFFQTLRPGPSHAGVYLGDGRFVHSSSGAGRVLITPMDHPYYASRYLGARRF